MPHKKLEFCLFEYFDENRTVGVDETSSVTYYLLQEMNEYSEKNSMFGGKEDALIGAYLNIFDYFGEKPILVMRLDAQPKIGKVFKDIFLLNPENLPRSIRSVVVNRETLKLCADDDILTVSDKIQFILSPEGKESLEQCIIVGIYGNDSIHLSRGMSQERGPDTISD